MSLNILRNAILAAVAAALSVNASPTTLIARQTSSAPPLPAGWVSVGCFSDTPSSRTLNIAAFTDVTGMTIESCLSFCTPAGYVFAGLEFARECYCDNVIEAPAVPTSSLLCVTPCTGNANETCGGTAAISIFKNLAVAGTPTVSLSTTTATPTSGSTPFPGPTIKQSVSTFQYKGCYQDVINSFRPRSLTQQIAISGGATAETCTTACKAGGFILAGLENGGECWCDIYMPYATLSPDTQCNMACTADHTESCGAANRLAVYVDSSATPLNLQSCLNSVQLQTGNVEEFLFDLEAHFIPAFPGAPVSAPGLLGDSPVSPTGFRFDELSSRTSTSPHTYLLPVDTVADSEPLFVLDTAIHGEFLGFALPPVPGANQIFDVDPPQSLSPTFSGFCAQPNPFTVSTYIGPPVLAVNQQAQVWSFCTGGTGPFGLVYLRNATSGTCSDVVLAMTPPQN